MSRRSHPACISCQFITGRFERGEQCVCDYLTDIPVTRVDVGYLLKSSHSFTPVVIAVEKRQASEAEATAC